MMHSPFPGMDPYLEDPAFWRDFHHTFTNYWREAVADRLPENYEARLDETISLVEMSPEVRQVVYPDIAVTKTRRQRPSSRGNGSVATLEPVTILHEGFEQVRETWVEIRHRPEGRLVAVLEMLSPWNKTGEGYYEYCKKHRSILNRNVHLLELDLLVAGTRLPFAEPMPPADYYFFLSRAERRPYCEVYAWTVRQPLPRIPIPLRQPDKDIHVDLEAVFTTAYERGRYKSLRYGKKPLAPLSAADLAWAKNRSRAKSGTARSTGSSSS